MAEGNDCQRESLHPSQYHPRVDGQLIDLEATDAIPNGGESFGE